MGGSGRATQIGVRVPTIWQRLKISMFSTTLVKNGVEHLLKVTDITLDWQQSFNTVEKFLKVLTPVSNGVWSTCQV